MHSVKLRAADRRARLPGLTAASSTHGDVEARVSDRAPGSDARAGAVAMLPIYGLIFRSACRT
jgi:hypothetical protein